jgi:hypothetical protein
MKGPPSAVREAGAIRRRKHQDLRVVSRLQNDSDDSL